MAYNLNLKCPVLNEEHGVLEEQKITVTDLLKKGAIQWEGQEEFLKEK